jgi:hypothetical protein
MRPLPLVVIALLIAAAPASALGPYYARGDYYAGSSGTWNFDAGNQLFDDGLHGDGAAGDGVYGASVTADQAAGMHDFKIANTDWSENWPYDYYRPTTNARLWITGPGDVVHFRLDTNANVEGWLPNPNAVATDHFAPPGTAFEVLGSDPETGLWTGAGIPATLTGTVWRAEASPAAVGWHAFKFRSVGTWDVCSFSMLYNMPAVAPQDAAFEYWTGSPGARVVFELDVEKGQARALVTSPRVYYARGDFYAGANGTWNFDDGNRLYDDGLHGDGAAGDDVFAGDVVSDQPAGHHDFKIANADWGENWPGDPNRPLVNGQLWTSGPGDVVHFRLDTNPASDGWQPVWPAVATDHGMPNGAEFEVMSNAPEFGAWGGPGVPAIQAGSTLRAEAVIATAGSYEFKFRVRDTWDLCDYGLRYNMTGSPENFTFTTTVPNAHVMFEMDLGAGRGRAFQFDPTPVRRVSWGRLKAKYR